MTMPAGMRRFLLPLALLGPLSPALAQQASPQPPPARHAPSLPASAPDQALLGTVERVLAQAPAGTRYGLLVEALDGTELLAIAPDQRFIPASNTKLFTTLAAQIDLASLQAAAEGTGVRLEPVGDGRFDVILEGRGDAGLSGAEQCASNCLATLADAVAAATQSVRHVVGDASWYPDERWSPGMSWNNIQARYGAGISALSIDDNESAVTITPTAPGQAPAVSGNGYHTIANRAVTNSQDKANLSTWRMPNDREVALTGTIGIAAQPATLRFGIDDPAHYAAWQLARMLEQRGVRISGAIEARHRPLSPSDDPARRGGAAAPQPPAEAMLAQLPPQDLTAELHTINKVSHNVRAELLLRRVARHSGSGSLADAEAALAAAMAQAGVPKDGYTLADGSGMSTYNRMTPRAAAALLRWAAGQPWAETFRKTLPIGGVDGTLARRFTGTALERKLYAKTGSLNASRALSGYLTTTGGQTLVFSAFANDIPPGGEGAALSAMDAALLAVAAAH